MRLVLLAVASAQAGELLRLALLAVANAQASRVNELLRRAILASATIANAHAAGELLWLEVTLASVCRFGQHCKY